MQNGVGMVVRNGFMDLNVMPQGSKIANKEILQFLADYGYECVAFNHEAELTGKKIQIKAAPDVRSLVDTSPRLKGGGTMKVLQRLTVTAEDPSVLHILSSPSVESYDLLAICPGSDKVLQQACSVLNVDIISMKLDERLPFRMKHTQIGQAVSRGVYFEICYSPAIRDSTARRNTLANALELVDVARRKNIIVSSRAEKALDTRGTSDVVNLCHLFGLTGDVCKSCITTHCRSALLHSAMRRKTAKGVVTCEVIGDTHPQTRHVPDKEALAETLEQSKTEERAPVAEQEDKDSHMTEENAIKDKGTAMEGEGAVMEGEGAVMEGEETVMEGEVATWEGVGDIEGSGDNVGEGVGKEGERDKAPTVKRLEPVSCEDTMDTGAVTAEPGISVKKEVGLEDSGMKAGGSARSRRKRKRRSKGMLKEAKRRNTNET